MIVSAASLVRRLRILPIFLIEQKAAFDIAVTWQFIVSFESIITPKLRTLVAGTISRIHKNEQLLT